MAGMPDDMLNFWIGIDRYAAGGHLSDYFVDRIGDGQPVHHLSFHPSFMPLLFFEEGVAGDRKFFLGSVSGVYAELEGGKAVHGGVALRTYLGTYGLKTMRVDCGKGTLGAYVNFKHGFPLFGGSWYSGLTTDHEKVGSVLKGAGVWDISIGTSVNPLTIERLVKIMRKYNKDVRGNSVDIHPSDPFGFVYNWRPEQMDKRIKEELASRRMSEQLLNR